MKKYLFAFWFALTATGLSAQTVNNKLSFTAGGGFQFYYGDLGNNIYKLNPSSYGSVNISLGYYLTRSFDAGFLGFVGDYGYCQTEEMKNTEVPLSDRCPGCTARIGMGNLNSRLTSEGIFLRYKIANGYLFSESSRIRPYIFSGVVFNHVSDRMKKNCVVAGNYYSVNNGLGLRYYMTEKISIGCDLTVGYFLSDKLDYIKRCRNDMYIQNTFFLGIDLF
ncbi:MAG TPA: hypothetical protein VE978_25800 [Chitinophagales bacterium]|nr:hypothetical protein [Chitinophagales bacterium]